jgi:hypothetical protein
MCGKTLKTVAHSDCQSRAELEPPRWCANCGRRMVVQVTPNSWSARCVEHGTINSGDEGR